MQVYINYKITKNCGISNQKRIHYNIEKDGTDRGKDGTINHTHYISLNKSPEQCTLLRIGYGKLGTSNRIVPKLQ